MEPWITVAELEVWAQEAISPTDPYALVVIQASTIKVSEATGYHGTTSEFTAASAPDGLKVIVAQVAKRNWLNPTQVIREGSLGPLGGDTFAAAFAAGMSLTDEEEAEIAKIARRAVEGATQTGLGMLRLGAAHNPVGTSREGYVSDTPGDGSGFQAGSDWLIPLGK